MIKQLLTFFYAIPLALPIPLLAETASVEGQIQNAGGGDAIVYYSTSYLGRDRAVFRGSVDEEGRFEMEVEMEEARLMTFSYGGEQATIYLKPGDDLFVRLDTEEFDETLKFEGKGESVAASNYLAAHFLKFEDTEVQKGFQEAFYNQPIFRAKGYMLDLIGAQEKFLLGYQQEHGLSEEFTNLMLDRTRYGIMGNLLNLPSYRAYVDGMPMDELELPKDFYNFLGKVELNKSSALILPEYRNFLISYLEYEYSKGADEERTNEVPKKAAIANSIFKNDIGQFVQASMILEQLSYGSFIAGERMLMDYKKGAKNEKKLPYLDVIEPLYKEIKPISPGNKAPAIVLKDKDGQEVSLEDFEGKLVYIDFWASWCGPCRREMPFARKLQRDFKGKDIVFLYVSIDDTEEAWRKGMEEENLDGVHVWAQGFKNEVTQAYRVNSIPNYFLIDKHGVILDNNPPRPSGPSLPYIINSHINEP